MDLNFSPFPVRPAIYYLRANTRVKGEIDILHNKKLIYVCISWRSCASCVTVCVQLPFSIEGCPTETEVKDKILRVERNALNNIDQSSYIIFNYYISIIFVLSVYYTILYYYYYHITIIIIFIYYINIIIKITCLSYYYFIVMISLF